MDNFMQRRNVLGLGAAAGVVLAAGAMAMSMLVKFALVVFEVPRWVGAAVPTMSLSRSRAVRSTL
jgi:hypothetical protein